MRAFEDTQAAPLVSVVMPTFKRQDYFKLALESAVQQSYAQLEILIGDNENSAETAQIVTTINDPRVQYLGRSENLGMVGNNLDLFKRATGKYVVNLHDDDLWYEDFVVKMVAILERNDAVNIAFSDSFIIDGQGAIDFALTEQTMRDHKRDVLAPGLHHPAYQAALVDRSVPTTLCGVMRRDAIDFDFFPAEVGNVYDLWLCYLALANGGAIYYRPERLAYRRVHPDADSTHAFVNLNRNTIYCYKHFLNDPRLTVCTAEFQEWIGRAAVRLGTMLLEQGHAAEARPWLLDAMRYKPSSRALIGLLISYAAGERASAVIHGFQALLAQARRFRTAGHGQALREH